MTDLLPAFEYTCKLAARGVAGLLDALFPSTALRQMNAIEDALAESAHAIGVRDCCCDDERVLQPCGPCRYGDDHEACVDLTGVLKEPATSSTITIHTEAGEWCKQHSTYQVFCAPRHFQDIGPGSPKWLRDFISETEEQALEPLRRLLADELFPKTPAASATDAVEGIPPAGAHPTPAGADLTWIGWALPAILDVLAEHKFRGTKGSDPTLDQYGWCVAEGCEEGLTEDEWREHVGYLIAHRVGCDPVRAIAALATYLQ